MHYSQQFVCTINLIGMHYKLYTYETFQLNLGFFLGLVNIGFIEIWEFQTLILEEDDSKVMQAI
jgi:hypothetical protein